MERPKNRDHGDWATNIALQLAKKAGTNPREFATILSTRLKSINGVAAVDIAGPGFLNITVDAAAAGTLAKAIVEAGPEYGTNSALAGHTVNMEFVSANPTGPLHIGHTRWAALGDSIARVLRASGARGHRRVLHQRRRHPDERVRQLRLLARLHGRHVPEGGYPGQYIARPRP